MGIFRRVCEGLTWVRAHRVLVRLASSHVTTVFSFMCTAVLAQSLTCSVSQVTRLLTVWTTRGSTTGRSKEVVSQFCLRHHVQTNLGSHPTIPIGTQGADRGGKVAGEWRWPLSAIQFRFLVYIFTSACPSARWRGTLALTQLYLLYCIWRFWMKGSKRPVWRYCGCLRFLSCVTKPVDVLAIV